MTQKEFYELKERTAESHLPFKLVDRAAIKYVGRIEDNGKEGIRPHETLASMTVWELYNGVTAFASHNTDWHINDNRRSGLQGAIYNFLLRPRDIKIYVDAYQGM